MIRDQVVFRIKDKRVWERLLREIELTLAGSVKICHASELALQHAKTFSYVARDTDGDSAAVAIVSARIQRPRAVHTKRHKGTETLDCKRCGSRHAPKKCPTYGKVCSKCKGQNHFAKQCFSKGKKGQDGQMVEETALSDTFFVGMVTQEDSMSTGLKKTSANNVEQDPWIEVLHVNGADITLKLDTGAKVNLLNELDIKAMKVKPLIHPNSKPLKAYNGQPITIGTCRL